MSQNSIVKWEYRRIAFKGGETANGQDIIAASLLEEPSHFLIKRGNSEKPFSLCNAHLLRTA